MIELFQENNPKGACRADELNREYQVSHMDNVPDTKLILDDEKARQEEEWIFSAYSIVTFRFSCLNRMLRAKKKRFLSEVKNTGYENGRKNNHNQNSKFYHGEYDISDFDELMYETVIEIFTGKTDENNCLTLDGKKNLKTPICDGASLLKNISYFTSRKINKRARTSCLDLPDTRFDEELGVELSRFDNCARKEFLRSQGGTARLAMYAEALEWLEKNDLYQLFQSAAWDIKAIIETILNCPDTFTADTDGKQNGGTGLCLVKLETLQKMIQTRHNRNIDPTNIARDLELIEQRLLDHLFYSLNVKIDKAPKGGGIYQKESERFLYERDEKAYVKIFGRAGYELYDESIRYIGNLDSDRYERILKRHEDMVRNVIPQVKRLKKCNLKGLAHTIITLYQTDEEEYRTNKLGHYRTKGLAHWENGYWEAELKGGFFIIKLWSSQTVKHPIRFQIKREALRIYCGYMNFYLCDTENKICCGVPKNRRVISKADKNHKILMLPVV